MKIHAAWKQPANNGWKLEMVTLMHASSPQKNIEYLELLEITGKLWTCLFLCTQWQQQQGRTQSIEPKITEAGFLAKPHVGIEENWQHTVMLNTRPPWDTFSITPALIARLFELACSDMDHPCHVNHASLGENKAESVYLCLSNPLHSSKFELLQAADHRQVLPKFFKRFPWKRILCISASLSKKQKTKKGAVWSNQFCRHFKKRWWFLSMFLSSNPIIQHVRKKKKPKP